VESQRDSLRRVFDASDAAWDKVYSGAKHGARMLRQRQRNGVELVTAYVRPTGKVLDVGCGAGHAVVELARRGFEPIGLDLSDRMVERARGNAERAGVADRCRFEVGALEERRRDLGDFDGILTMGALGYFDDLPGVLKVFRDLLRPGGVAVVHVWNRRSAQGTLVISFERLARRLRSLPTSESGLWHRSYAPSELEAYARSAGLVPLRALGSRFVPLRPHLADWLKRAIESWISGLAVRVPLLHRFASDYVVALRRPDDRGSA
jgi:cyclopropane fatty-acyl-phospholipid synthase-like methyltransferase